MVDVSLILYIGAGGYDDFFVSMNKFLTHHPPLVFLSLEIIK